MIWNELLPAGSVVLLKNSAPTERFMIIGFAQVEMTEKKVYDYVAVAFPQGYQDDSHVYFFDYTDIEKIYCVGFIDGKSDERRQEALKLLADVKNGDSKREQLIDEALNNLKRVGE